MHSHFIPGIDDGAQTPEDSLQLIRGLSELGYQKIITTPHVMADTYRNGPENILPGLASMQQLIQQEKIPVVLEASAEYYIDSELEEKINTGKLLPFASKHVLFEMPFISEPPNLGNIIFALQLGTYKPIMAHVERYPFWHTQFNKIIDLKDKGVYLQLNISSLTGYYSPAVKKMAEKLVNEKMVDFLGSDCHHLGHIELLKQACYLPYLDKALHTCPILNHTL